MKLLKRVVSIYKLKRTKCSYSSDIPFIDRTVEIKNNNNISFLGFAFLDKFVILSNKNGEIELGDNISIKRFVKLENLNGKLKVGTNTTINEFTIIKANTGDILIGKNVQIAPSVKIFGENHTFDNPKEPIYKQGLNSKGIKIGNNVWLGTGVIVLDGVTIGDNVIIGAGSVVNKDITENSIAVGNPVRIVRNLY